MTYRISALRRVPKARLTAGTDAFAQDGPARLVLVTCGGHYDATRHTYEDNLLVTATPAA
jgi:hypothetical protein